MLAYIHVGIYHNVNRIFTANSSLRGVMATRLTSNQKIMGSTPIVSALFSKFRDSLMVRMGACRVPDRGSIPRRGDFFSLLQLMQTSSFKALLPLNIKLLSM